MRRFLLALSLLCLLTLPSVAHADQIDDLVFTSDPSNPFLESFVLTLAASGTLYVYYAPFDDYILEAPVLNPLPFPYNSPLSDPLVFLSNDPQAGYSLLSAPYMAGRDFEAPQLLAISPAGTYTFLPGTYSIGLRFYDPYPTLLPYTLTITPEASPIPEPSSLLLVGTGLLSTATLARQKVHRRANRSTL